MTAVGHIRKYAIEMMTKGMSKQSIITYLTKNEHTQEEAEEFYLDLEKLKPQLLRHAKDVAVANGEIASIGTILWGLLWLIGGIGITVGTYAAGGGAYLVATGPIVYGLFTVFKGLPK